MKFRNFGQTSLAIAVSLIVGLGLSACNARTIDYVYAITSKNVPGQVVVYAVDSSSGTLTPVSKGIYSAGSNPVAAVTSPNDQNLYVVNHDDSTITQFAIATDGTLTSKATTTTPGTLPTAVAINATGTFLYVVDTYQPGFSVTVPGPGAVVVYPIASGGTLGTPVVNTSVTPNVSYFAVGNAPTGVSAPASGTSVYVVNKADATVSAFTTGSSGTLTLVATVPAGTAPYAIAVDPTSRFIYVTDTLANQLIAYAAQSNGGLHTVNNNGPFSAGNFPDAVTIDPRGLYLYVANYNATSSVSAYAIDRSTGAPSGVAGTPSNSTGPGPKCVIVEPSLGRYVYTSNLEDNSISGCRLDVHSGALTPLQNTPYPTPGGTGSPTCLVAVTHGNHATQTVLP